MGLSATFLEPSAVPKPESPFETPLAARIPKMIRTRRIWIFFFHPFLLSSLLSIASSMG